MTEVHIHIHAGGIDAARLDSIDSKLTAVLEGQVQLMSKFDIAKETLDQLNSTTNTVAEAIDKVIAADQAEDDAFRAEIADLKKQIADGEAVTAAQLDELTSGMGGTTDTLKAVAEHLKSIGSTPSDPIPVPDIPPVEAPAEPTAPPAEPA